MHVCMYVCMYVCVYGTHKKHTPCASDAQGVCGRVSFLRERERERVCLYMCVCGVFMHMPPYTHRGGLGRGKMHLQRRGPASPGRNSRKSAPQSDNVASIQGHWRLGNLVYISTSDDRLSVTLHLITTFLAIAIGESVDGDGIRVFYKAEHRETHTKTHK